MKRAASHTGSPIFLSIFDRRSHALVPIPIPNPPIWSEASHWVQAAHNWFSIFGAAGYAWAAILQTRSVRHTWSTTTALGTNYNQYLFSVWLSITALHTLQINFKHRHIYLVYFFFCICINLYVQWWVISATSSHPKSLMILAWTLTFSVLRIPPRTVVRWFQHLNFTGESRPTCFMFHPTGMGLAVIWNKSFWISY